MATFFLIDMFRYEKWGGMLDGISLQGGFPFRHYFVDRRNQLCNKKPSGSDCGHRADALRFRFFKDRGVIASQAAGGLQMQHITIKRLPLFWTVSTVFVFTFLFGAATDSFAFVRLSVQDATGHQRVDEPLTSGVPLPESMGIASVGDLVVTDEAGPPIQAQFTVLSRWNGTPSDTAKPIKWVLVNFQADAPRNGSGTYHLRKRSEAGAPPSYAGMSVSEGADGFTVDTGKAKYAISKRHFNVFDHVWVDGDNDGQLNEPVLSQPGEGGVVLTDRSGKEYRALFEAPEEIAIEEQGPFKTIIRIRGVLKSADGTYFEPSVHRSGGYSSFDQP
jgi:hypothetical protein